MIFSTGNPPFLFRESILHKLCEFFVGPEANPWEEITQNWDGIFRGNSKTLGRSIVSFLCVAPKEASLSMD